MPFELPALPWAEDALESKGMSKETISYHYGKHHQGYVNKLNAATKGTKDENASLEDLIKTAEGGIFNCAAQTWNHTFFWNSLSPNGGGEPTGAIADAIKRDFGSFEEFKAKFQASAAGHFGSGWAWLVQKDGKLQVVSTHDAGNPLRDGTGTPILCCDVWEHAYYIDFRNNRGAYIDCWWSLVNWEFANKNLA
eukprot:TRINITY_DN4697_c0_g1_i1.p1 TRINITY_DN4697_c0_g1~~TRINITY_DN4697_c0_g1_i1.p1  ORF type:complete len:204 (-),score=72.94 TRINITY_DN4697_c0_g1_i1:210-791(-)